MQSFKLTKAEEEALYKKSIAVNIELLKFGKTPLPESKILHEILKQTLLTGDVELTRTGEIRVLSQNEISSKFDN
ncbi:hypothetical protein LU290_05415 [Moraxella nasibovis]|uniref:hypothetical protein n=1 Tax=Moraxella nasibovis TaxID=2904120 RepID=UPI002410AEA4|nr:hypothetical protein [Moraxella nasibovis]WFF37714.1 hypothetical protein LU290_05375 [Moraxella nasibovis]WFF37717.1 hypothetical protein LU290_05395 [Moraxella nasibovis]WFF37720.1 hypothetical protein LU290_05415 [Moraxella nasibovis]